MKCWRRRKQKHFTRSWKQPAPWHFLTMLLSTRFFEKGAVDVDVKSSGCCETARETSLRQYNRSFFSASVSVFPCYPRSVSIGCCRCSYSSQPWRKKLFSYQPLFLASQSVWIVIGSHPLATNFFFVEGLFSTCVFLFIPFFALN